MQVELEVKIQQIKRSLEAAQKVHHNSKFTKSLQKSSIKHINEQENIKLPVNCETIDSRIAELAKEIQEYESALKILEKIQNKQRIHQDEFFYLYALSYMQDFLAVFGLKLDIELFVRAPNSPSAPKKN